jgi:tetratricopeptide (TPR) repeat protein
VKAPAVITVVALILVLAFLVGRGGEDRLYTTSSQKAYEMFLSGEEALNAFRMHEADSLLTRAVELDPRFAMARASLAIARRYTQRKQASEIAAEADSLARPLADGERMLVQLRLAVHGLSRRVDPDSLVSLLEKIRPNDPELLRSKAILAMQEWHGEKAAELWRRVLAIDPNDARAYNYLGYNAAYMGRYEEALQYLNKYVFLTPKQANPHDSLGEILSYLGRYEEAEREFRLALELQPDFYPSLLNLARVYMEQGRVDTAVKILSTLREQVAGTTIGVQIDELLVRLFYQQDLRPRLRQALETYVSRYPENSIACYYRSLLQAWDGSFAASQAALDSFLTERQEELARRWTPVEAANLEYVRHAYRATVAEMQGDWQAAVTGWQAALEAMREFPVQYLFHAYVHYANALLKLQRPAEALAQVDRVLDVNPRWIPALLLRTESLLRLERYAESRQALDFLEAALTEAQPDFPAVAAADSLDRVLAARLGS